MENPKTNNLAQDFANEIDTARKSRPIDLVHLAKQSLGDPALEQEVLRMFDNVIVMQQKRVHREDDVKEISEGLHALKGASAGVGAMGIHAQAVAAEKEYANEGKLSSERLSDLEIAIVEVRQFISELLIAQPA